MFNFAISWKNINLFWISNLKKVGTGWCGIHVFHKEFQISINLITEHFSDLSQSILINLWPKEDSSVSGSYSHMASSVHKRALTCICGWRRKLYFSAAWLSKELRHPILNCVPVSASIFFYLIYILWLIYGFMTFANHQNLLLFSIYLASQLLLKLGCIEKTTV